MAFKVITFFNKPNFTTQTGLRFTGLRYRVAGSGSVGAAASSGASSNLPSSGAATITQLEAAALAIYTQALAMGLTDQQAQAVAYAAALAYAAAINQGLTVAQAQGAAAVAAAAAAASDFASAGADPFGWGVDEGMFWAAFCGVVAQVPAASQSAAQDAFLAYLQNLGL